MKMPARTFFEQINGIILISVLFLILSFNLVVDFIENILKILSFSVFSGSVPFEVINGIGFALLIYIAIEHNKLAKKIMSKIK